MARKKAPPRAGSWTVDYRRGWWWVDDATGKPVGKFEEGETAYKFAAGLKRSKGGTVTSSARAERAKKKKAKKKKAKKKTTLAQAGARARRQRSAAGRLVVETKHMGGAEGDGRHNATGGRWLAQLEWVDCGRCMYAHGPYWYAYTRMPGSGGKPGRLLSVYVGRDFNEAKARKRLKEKGADYLS